jgi:peptide deformylase
VPSIQEILERPQHVWVKNRRPDGTWYELEGQDLLARALCHEIDHLRGRLFVDYLGPVKRQILQRRFQKMRKQQA